MSIPKLLILNTKLLAVLIIALLIKTGYDRRNCETLSARLYTKRQATLGAMLADCGTDCLSQMVSIQRQLKLIDDAALSMEGCAK